MKDKYSNTFIFKVCNDLGITMKQLARMTGKTLKTIENWRINEESIPVDNRQYLDALMHIKHLEHIIVNNQKDRQEFDLLTSDIDCQVDILNVSKSLVRVAKAKTNYRLILQEI